MKKAAIKLPFLVLQILKIPVILTLPPMMLSQNLHPDSPHRICDAPPLSTRREGKSPRLRAWGE